MTQEPQETRERPRTVGDAWKEALNPVPNVAEAISKVMQEMQGVGKDQRNTQQGYSYRGIDDVLKAAKPALARHGVVFVPDVRERIAEQRMTRNNTIMWTVHLHVRYRVYGPAGDHITASTWGEGTDSGDKATNKAMTAAFKYALFQVLAVSDPTEDADASTPPESTPYKPVSYGRGRDWQEQERVTLGQLSRPEPPAEPQAPAEVKAAISRMLNSVEDRALRTEHKARFMAKFGVPSELPSRMADVALSWVQENVGSAPTGHGRLEGDPPAAIAGGQDSQVLPEDKAPVAAGGSAPASLSEREQATQLLMELGPEQGDPLLASIGQLDGRIVNRRLKEYGLSAEGDLPMRRMRLFIADARRQLRLDAPA